MSHAMTKNNAGLTLIELMFTAGVMMVGLVMLMSSVINISASAKASEFAVRSTNFNTSVLESLRGRDRNAILQFNDEGQEFDISNGIIQIDGIGPVEFHMWLVHDNNGSIQRLAIPMSDDGLAALGTVTNPMEIQVEIRIDRGLGSGNEMKFRTSSLIYY